MASIQRGKEGTTEQPHTRTHFQQVLASAVRLDQHLIRHHSQQVDIRLVIKMCALLHYIASHSEKDAGHVLQSNPQASKASSIQIASPTSARCSPSALVSCPKCSAKTFKEWPTCPLFVVSTGMVWAILSVHSSAHVLGYSMPTRASSTPSHLVSVLRVV